MVGRKRVLEGFFNGVVARNKCKVWKFVARINCSFYTFENTFRLFNFSLIYFLTLISSFDGNNRIKIDCIFLTFLQETSKNIHIQI